MWFPEEQRLFSQANLHNSRLQYEDAIAVSDRLLAIVTNEPRKFAYVLACRKAVALRHLGYVDEAHAAFEQAYHMAQAAEEPIITAYVLNDWSSMFVGDNALCMIREVLNLCQQAAYTPDPERVLEADHAYFQATFAHALESTGSRKDVRALLSKAKKVLRKYAHGSHPRYEQAYFIVLLWELNAYARPSPLALLHYAGRLCAVTMEAIRQGKIASLRLHRRQ